MQANPDLNTYLLPSMLSPMIYLNPRTPGFAEHATANVKHIGFSSRVQDELRRSSAFVFPSECEGFAKATLEAAAKGELFA